MDEKFARFVVPVVPSPEPTGDTAKRRKPPVELAPFPANIIRPTLMWPGKELSTVLIASASAWPCLPSGKNWLLRFQFDVLSRMISTFGAVVDDVVAAKMSV